MKNKDVLYKRVAASTYVRRGEAYAFFGMYDSAMNDYDKAICIYERLQSSSELDAFELCDMFQKAMYSLPKNAEG